MIGFCQGARPKAIRRSAINHAPSEAHCQADRGINAEFSRKILDRSVTILLDKNRGRDRGIKAYLSNGMGTTM